MLKALRVESRKSSTVGGMITARVAPDADEGARSTRDDADDDQSFDESETGGKGVAAFHDFLLPLRGTPAT